MAEDYGVSLKITADTSDLDKIPKKVEATRKEIAQPVAQTVEAKVEQPAPVKVPVEQPAPVKVPVEQPTPVKVPVEKPEPVKVPVEQPTPVKVPVEQPAPVKVPVDQPTPVKVPVEQPEPVKVPVDQPTPVKVPVEQPTPVKVPVEQPTPVKVPVEQPTQVKVPVEKPTPVKIEAKAEKVRVEVEDAEAKKRIEALTKDEGVKRIRVVTEGGELATRTGGKEIFELEVDAEKAKKTIADLKQDNRIKFVVDQPEVKPVEVPVVQTPDPLKPKVEQPAPVTIKSRFDGTAIGTGINMLRSLRSIATQAMAAFGLFGLAVNGVMAVVSGVRMLHEWLNRAETKAKELREEMARTSYANAVAHAAASYDRLTESIAKANRLEKERNDILAARKQVERNLEDAQLEQSKQREISKLDPNAADYETKRKEIERSYDIKASDAKASRADEDARANADELYRAAKSKDKEADAIEREYRKQERIVDTAVENKFQAGMAVRRGEAGADEKYKEAEKAFEEAAAKADEIRKAMEAARAEAQSIRNRAAEQAGGNLTARIQNDANKQRIENERKQEEARAQKEAAEKDKRHQNAQSAYTENRDRRAADADWDARFRAAQRRASAPDATEAQRNEAENTKLNMLQEKEDAAKQELEAAEKELAEEMAKDAKDRNEDRMSRARERAARAQGEQISAAQQKADLANEIENRRIGQVQDYFGNLARQVESSRPQNRLTAMGLGSGGPSDSTGREQISIQREIAKSLREAIAAIRAQNHGDGTAVYAP